MRYRVYHKSEYNYNSQVTFSHNIARLKPLDTEFQKLLDYKVELLPLAYELKEFTDFWGNHNLHFLIREAHQNFSMVAKSMVELDTSKINDYNLKASKQTITYKELRDRFSSFHQDDFGIKQYMLSSPFVSLGNESIKEYAIESFKDNRSLYDATLEFMGRVFNDFEFDSCFSDISTPIDEIYSAKKGVCQDFAHFSISALRSIGIACRYVSGYIQTIPLDGEEKLFGVDASHAWFSVYIPDFGWIDFDPTNNIIPTSQHIVIGYGRDYSDIAPLKGVVQSSGVSNLSVMVDVSSV
jgi:transglutaminase-like putative cysteine protease